MMQLHFTLRKIKHRQQTTINHSFKTGGSISNLRWKFLSLLPYGRLWKKINSQIEDEHLSYWHGCCCISATELSDLFPTQARRQSGTVICPMLHWFRSTNMLGCVLINRNSTRHCDSLYGWQLEQKKKVVVIVLQPLFWPYIDTRPVEPTTSGWCLVRWT